MSVDFTPEQQQIRDSVAKLCNDFGDQYWLERDSDGRFPEDFCKAIADHGYMGIAMPVEYGGSGLGITEAALLMQTISESGAGNGGVSSVSIGIFGMNPVVRFGTEEQKRRMLPPLPLGQQGIWTKLWRGGRRFCATTRMTSWRFVCITSTPFGWGVLA